MTSRQQRRAQQKADRKAHKRELRRLGHEAHLATLTTAETASDAGTASLQNPARPAQEAVAAAGEPTLDSRNEMASSGRAVAAATIDAMREQGDISRVSPISEAQLLANRANSQKSTGAITAEGKQTVSQNATKHGLTGSNFRVLATENQAEFDKLLAGFLSSEAPEGDDEIAMVHQMAECMWLSRRSVRFQNECYEILGTGAEEDKRDAHKNLALYIRYQTTHDRAFTRYALELRKRRNERRKVENGFVSQKYKEAAEKRRIDMQTCKQRLHEVRLQGQILRQERMRINNRLAEAKAIALEAKANSANTAKMMSAAA